MLPAQKNKVDISSLTEEEQRLFRLYGKLPSKKDILKNKLKERKYFDSGDYALSKAGKASDVGVTNIGSQHPLPENIPHHQITSPGTPTGSGSSSSPVKESSLLHAKSPMGSQQPIEGEELSSANSAEEEGKAAAEQTAPEGSSTETNAVPIPSN
ncbi:Endosulfine-domain-containing protein [Morchella conica CCBAS932]|uniref:mRNA stability protein n=1 Tax=Morchella conica CCBAS932 TaxID=1392247 RepID=A0A3N4KSU2_9PEZI|nr:Endosulfine-domain-containing protein [Morchella conica CCBAS932]